MALDSKHKRGSAVLVGMPFRSWLAEPDGTLASTDRVSLLKWCSAVAPGITTSVDTCPVSAPLYNRTPLVAPLYTRANLSAPLVGCRNEVN